MPLMRSLSCVCVCRRQYSFAQGVLHQHGSGLDGEEATFRVKVPAPQSAAGPKELGPRHPAECLHGLPAREVHHGEREEEGEEEAEEEEDRKRSVGM